MGSTAQSKTTFPAIVLHDIIPQHQKEEKKWIFNHAAKEVQHKTLFRVRHYLTQAHQAIAHRE